MEDFHPLFSNKVFYIEDILHSGKSGKKGVSKEGRKFELRKNHYCRINYTDIDYEILINLYEDKIADNDSYWKSIMTTPCVDVEIKKDTLLLHTKNSIYVLRPIEEEKDDREKK